VFCTWYVRELRDVTKEEHLGKMFSVRSESKLYNKEQLLLKESIEAEVRRGGVSCETVACQ
jgi:hypothetical protein